MIKEVISEIVNEEEMPLVKVIGSALLFEDYNDIDIIVYDRALSFKLIRRAHKLGKHNFFHIILMGKDHWENIKDYNSFNNICLEWYMGEIIYSDHYTASKILEPNRTENGPFNTPGIIKSLKKKLLKRGYKK